MGTPARRTLVRQRLSQVWRSLDSFTQLAIQVAAVYGLVFVVLFAATAGTESAQFAIQTTLGVVDPYSAESQLAPVALAIWSLFFLPLALGLVIGAVLELVARRRTMAAQDQLDELEREISHLQAYLDLRPKQDDGGQGPE